MPAPRKYSDPQRQEIWRLHVAGMTSNEVAETLGKGDSGLTPFRISPRTVRDITGKMATEADKKLPTTVLELENAGAMERSPTRAARILGG